MRYWDTSAIIPLCLEEPQTPLLMQLAEEDGAIAAWWGTPVECCSALARLRREGILSRQSEAQARTILMALAAEWTELAPSQAVREQAVRALLLHPLHAADSLQLGSALVWVQGRPEGHEFVCLDHRMRDAAQGEGFRVLPHETGK